ncbi:MAG TPA: ABC transporter substrate-binding protein [Chloroflexota bacterium]
MQALSSTRITVILVGLCLTLAACGPSAPQSSAGGPDKPSPQSQPKILRIGLPDEPHNLATIFSGAGAGFSAGSSSASDLYHIVHQRLVVNDEKGNSEPELATELPSQERGTWVVRPDGTMQTIYRIRPGVTWQDGQPLTAGDFVFAWTLSLDKELPISQGTLARQVSRIDTPDDHTLVMEWSRVYPFANAIIEDDFGPFAEHILGPVYRSEKQAVPASGYWTRDFIGVGPYRVVDWQPGSGLTVRAYEAFYGGRPKLDTIVFQIIENPATAMANMLADTIDGVVPGTLNLEGASAIKREWQQAGKPPLFITQSIHWKRLGTQFRVPDPTDILDPRVRQGLMHAIDRAGMVDAMFGGYGTPADTFVPPDLTQWDWVKDSTTRYPYDPRRAQELLTSYGWRKGADGTFVNSAGAPVKIALWATAGSTEDVVIVGDNWKSIGVNVEQVVLSPAQSQNSEFRVSYPSFALASYPISFEFGPLNLKSSNCPSPDSQWKGNNRGCFKDAENDRLIEALSVAIPAADQQRLYGQIAKYQSDLLPELPLYFDVNFILFRPGVTGIRGSSMPRSGLGWNVLDWDVGG